MVNSNSSCRPKPGSYTVPFGTEKLLRELRRNSTAVHQLLRLVTNTIVAFSRAAIQRGVRLGLADPTASGSVVGKNAFETFALPYLTEVVQTIAQATGGAAPSLHVCGRTQYKRRESSGARVACLDGVARKENARESRTRPSTSAPHLN
jgi:uroporphyrinogen decarboxylase